MSKNPTPIINHIGSLSKLADEQGWSEETFTGALVHLREAEKDYGIYVATPSNLRPAAAAAAVAAATTINTITTTPAPAPAARGSRRKTDPEFVALQMRHKREGWTEERFTAEVMQLRERREREVAEEAEAMAKEKEWESSWELISVELVEMREEETQVWSQGI